ncbi:hypothetical protein V2A84_09315 [Yersinia sp. 2553 StPb PI]|uniref:hypothetical protein n=1 Tax=Yersinia sp. 2553 StPb PI TaxID=3117411 RepID=UPI003FA42658
MMIYVQLSDGTPKRLFSIFGGPQPDWGGDGYVELDIDPNTAYALNDYYNPADNKFYVDTDFIHLSGWIDPVKIYNIALDGLNSNGAIAFGAVLTPTSDFGAQTWWCQCDEANRYHADNTFSAPLLTSMVSASNGELTLNDLVQSILTSEADWKVAAGNIAWQIYNKKLTLQYLRDEVIAGTKTIEDIQNFDCSIIIPQLN